MSTPPVLPAFPNFPGRNTADADQYVADASAWGGAMPPWTEAVRALGAWMALQASGLAASFRLPLMATYTFDASTAVADPGPGKLRFNAGSTALLADAVDNLGMTAVGRLSRLTGTSTRKGSIAVYKSGDPTASVLADVTLATAVGGAGGYYNLTLTNFVTTGAALADGDDVVLVIQTNGDKGDQGNVGPASAWVLDNTFNPTGTPNLITLAVPSGFNDLKFEIDGVVPSGVDTLYMAVSTNGSTFSSLIPVNTGNLAAFYGNVELAAYNTTMPIIRGAISSALGGAPAASSVSQLGVGNARVASAVTHVRFGLGNGANTFVAGGAIRTYRK